MWIIGIIQDLDKEKQHSIFNNIYLLIEQYRTIIFGYYKLEIGYMGGCHIEYHLTEHWNGWILPDNPDINSLE